MPQSVTELIDLLDLEEIEIGLFRARQPDTQLQRVFGGQVLAQARGSGADRAVTGSCTRCMLICFAGRTDIPIVYDVEAVRDGGSFSSRRVVARQGGKVIFYLSSSFHELEEGFEHLDLMPRTFRRQSSVRSSARCSSRHRAGQSRSGNVSGECSMSATPVTLGPAAH